MKQLVQHIRTGKAEVVDVPAPRAFAGQILVRVGASLVSAGTERMVVEFAEANLLAKARSRPDLVRQTLEKARREGLLTTLEAIQNRLDAPMALGYSVAGEVIAVGEGVAELKVGDRVAAAGGGHAVHAEVVSIPINLALPLPASVSWEVGAFTTLGAIALQGLRLAEVALGGRVAVIGLGLLGQLSAQLARASGCHVEGYDPQESRAELARTFGCSATTSVEAFAAACLSATGGQGVDAVLIAADTPSNEPVTLAGRVARDCGAVVAVGAVGLALPRKVYYEKELRFHVSRSYGPGRYDEAYEERGQDYPYAYVRWTENRNMRAFVELVADRRVELGPLISHRVPIADGERAYEIILGKTGEPFLGVVLTYPERGDEATATRVDVSTPAGGAAAPGEVGVALLGAGNFAKATLLPAMRKTPGTRLVGVCTASGLSSRDAARRFGFAYCTTESDQILRDPDVRAVVITTRHHQHAAQVCRALEAGKHVFVEKPLCLDATELARVSEALTSARAREPGLVLMVGFNRRFAPLALALRRHFGDSREPLLVQYRVNAGYIPPSHWTQDPAQGGGRLLGEAVHFIDWALWCVGAPPVEVSASALPDGGRYSGDNLAITLTFANGAVAQVLYAANGDRALGKERIEVHGRGRSAVLEDFRRLDLFADGRRATTRHLLRADKGHAGEWRAFVEAVAGRAAVPIPYEEIEGGMRAGLAAVRAVNERRVVGIREI